MGRSIVFFDFASAGVAGAAAGVVVGADFAFAFFAFGADFFDGAFAMSESSGDKMLRD